MKRVLRISSWPGILVFALAGVSIVIVGFFTYNLLQMSMANLRFLREHGWLAIEVGGLLQFLQLLIYGVVALFFFILFKICESELVIRYRRWQDR
ncbi:hypothetical protein [Marimonas arenosa]|uniref:Uncharacterized protein n=1 Tax=Marimonas arenosa TaxID=1795305 RepID=A0AAE4B5G9_9RHOB|nr:hypothetical protein [Marimonas arenosa]MDQ2090319.1 hypothetical protein [Marimonas arenosa]